MSARQHSTTIPERLAALDHRGFPYFTVPIMLILLVEDDSAIVRLLGRGLTTYGYEFTSAEDGEEGVRLAMDRSVELVLLDISLPKLGGVEVLRNIRDRRPTLPVMMLTARDDIASKVGTLESGADDYLTKPFVFEELLARIRTLSRRASYSREPYIRIGDLTIDSVSRRVRRGGRQIELSATEFDLLEYLARNGGRALSRREIFSEIWDYPFDTDSNTIDVYVRYLRRKLDREGEPSLISTVRGVGYRLEPPRDA